MLTPEDPLERECRCFAHLAGEVAYLEKEAREAKAMGIDPTSSEERRDSLRDFSGGVSKLLVARGYSPKGMPPIPDMLKEIGERNAYAIYALLCQTTHGGHYSTWIFRAGGVGKLIQSTPYLEEMTYSRCGKSKTQHMSRENNWTRTEDVNHINCYRTVLNELMRDGTQKYLAGLGGPVKSE